MAGAAVTHRVTATGVHQLGVKIDGQFVPFVSVTADRVNLLVEQEKRDADQATDDDEKGGE